MADRKCCPQDPSIETEWMKQLAQQRESIPDEVHIEQIYEILHAISHPIRLKIAFFLLPHEQCVCELVQLTGKAPNLISHHLMVMRESGIVTSYSKGGDKYYNLQDFLIPLLQNLQKISLLK